MSHELPPALDGSTTALHRRIEEVEASNSEMRANIDAVLRIAEEGIAFGPRTLALSTILGILRQSALAPDEALQKYNRRIEELTAERASLRELTVDLQKQLDAWLATTWQNPEQAMGCLASWKDEEESWAEEFAQLRSDLATERAAREQAVEERNLQREECRQLRQSEANARTVHVQAETELQMSRLATQQAERERDTALARVKELESKCTHDMSVMQDLLDIASEDLDSTRREKRDAETALASARELLARISIGARFPLPSDDPKLYEDLRAWLTSHPSPAPVGCNPTRNHPEAISCDKCREIHVMSAPCPDPVAAETTTCVDWKKHWGEVANGKRHPWHENACAPVADHPLNGLREDPCPACGKHSRKTTAGCDHCDHEDK